MNRPNNVHVQNADVSVFVMADDRVLDGMNVIVCGESVLLEIPGPADARMHNVVYPCAIVMMANTTRAMLLSVMDAFL